MTEAQHARLELESYFLMRLAEEAELAKSSANLDERTAHLRACQLLRELLELDTNPEEPAAND